MGQLTASESYEIKAEAFRLMTGHMAPGKDVAPAAYTAPLNERLIAFDKWMKVNGQCIYAMLQAFEHIMEPHGDES